MFRISLLSFQIPVDDNSSPQELLLTCIDALHFVMKTPEPTVWQHALSTEQLQQLIPAVKKYPLPAAQVSTDPSLTDGVPKPLEDDCPVCYKSCDDGEETVCCTSCGHHAHYICFNTKAQALSG